jgi:excisionase family DNA binding protein
MAGAALPVQLDGSRKQENNVSDKLAYTIPEAVAASGLGRTTIYELIKSGEVPIVKVGRRSVIRRQDLEAMLDRKVSRNDG